MGLWSCILCVWSARACLCVLMRRPSPPSRVNRVGVFGGARVLGWKWREEEGEGSGGEKTKPTRRTRGRESREASIGGVHLPYDGSPKKYVL